MKEKKAGLEKKKERSVGKKKEKKSRRSREDMVLVRFRKESWGSRRIRGGNKKISQNRKRCITKEGHGVENRSLNENISGQRDAEHFMSVVKTKKPRTKKKESQKGDQWLGRKTRGKKHDGGRVQRKSRNHAEKKKKGKRTICSPKPKTLGAAVDTGKDIRSTIWLRHN